MDNFSVEDNATSTRLDSSPSAKSERVSTAQISPQSTQESVIQSPKQSTQQSAEQAIKQPIKQPTSKHKRLKAVLIAFGVLILAAIAFLGSRMPSLSAKLLKL